MKKFFVVIMLFFSLALGVTSASATDLGALLGGLVGAGIGSQVGGGNGQKVAIAAGAVVGAITGDRMSNPAPQVQRVAYVQPQARYSSQPQGMYSSQPQARYSSQPQARYTEPYYAQQPAYEQSPVVSAADLRILAAFHRGEADRALANQQIVDQEQVKKEKHAYECGYGGKC